MNERDTFFGDKISPDDVTMITGAITYQLESRKNIYLNDRLFNSELEDAVASVVKDPSFDLKTFEEQITNHITEEQTLTDFQIAGAEEFNERLRNGDFEYLSRYTRDETNKLVELQETYDWLHIGTELLNDPEQELPDKFVVTYPSGTFNQIFSTNSIEELEKELSYEVHPSTDWIISLELDGSRHTPEAVRELTEVYFPKHGVDRDTRTLTGKEMEYVRNLLESNATAQDIVEAIKHKELKTFRDLQKNGYGDDYLEIKKLNPSNQMMEQLNKAYINDEIPMQRFPDVAGYMTYLADEFPEDFESEEEILFNNVNLEKLPIGISTFGDADEVKEVYPAASDELAEDLALQEIDVYWNVKNNTINDCIAGDTFVFEYPQSISLADEYKGQYLAMANVPEETAKTLLDADDYEAYTEAKEALEEVRYKTMSLSQINAEFKRDEAQMQRDTRYVEAALEEAGLINQDTYKEAYPGLEGRIVNAVHNDESVMMAMSQELYAPPQEMPKEALSSIAKGVKEEVAESLPHVNVKHVHGAVTQYADTNTKDLAAMVHDMQLLSRPKESLATAVADIYEDNGLGTPPKDVEAFAKAYDKTLPTDKAFKTPGLSGELAAVARLSNIDVGNQLEVMRYRLGSRTQQGMEQATVSALKKVDMKLAKQAKSKSR